MKPIDVRVQFWGLGPVGLSVRHAIDPIRF